MATETTFEAPTSPSSNKTTHKKNELKYHGTILFIRYLLVGLILAYWHYVAGLPSVVTRIMSRGGKDITNNDDYLSFYKTPNNQEPHIFNPDDWDDDAFVAQYHCNPNHTYRVQITNKDPLIMYLNSFLAPGEAEHLKAIAHPMMRRSTVTGKEESILHDGRTSSNAFLVKQHDKVVSCIENRAAHFSRKPVENMEGLQVVYYGEGQEYRPHFDYFEFGREGTDRELLRGGQREITIFVYLNTLNEGEGGATLFPTLKLGIKPEKRDAVFWYDMNNRQEEDPRTFHAGAPVEAKGREKWGLNIWIRERKFN